jgi:acyl carrier protein
MVARDERLKAHLAQIGLKGIFAQQGLNCILPALSGALPQVGIFEMDWLQQSAGLAVQTNRLSSLVDKKYENFFDDTVTAFRKMILKEENAHRIFAVTSQVIQIVASIFKIESSRIESNSDLVELGIDSLMAQELAMAILKQTGVRFRALYLLRGGKISEISEIILNEIIEGNKQSLVAVR